MKIKKYIFAFGIAALALTSCKDDDSCSSAMISVNAVYLENASSTVTNHDRLVEFGRLGQLLRFEGSGFSGLKKIYVNGYDTYFNNALLTDNNVWVQLSSNTPVEKAESDVRNIVRFYKNDGNYLDYSFVIRAAAPSISNVDNTLPKVGEIVNVQGSNLQQITKIILPDGTEITDGIISDEDGEWFTFTVPANADLTVPGSITCEGANGTAISPEYFNDFRNYIIDFDGKGEQGFWSPATYYPEDLVDDPLNTGRGKVAMLVPNVELEAGGLGSGTRTLLWATAGNDEITDDWTSRMYATIPANTPASEVALQFDIYCPEPWDGSGQLELSLQNNLSNYGYGSGCTKFSSQYTNTATVWVPWLNEEDGSHAAWSTGERWQTITIPMTKFGNYDPTEAPDVTFQKICEDRNEGSYRNFLFLFVNTDLEYSDEIIYTASRFTQKIYIDNLRVVKNAPITVSDFNDTEE